MSDTALPRTDRVDFQATTDPALMEASDRGEAQAPLLPRALRALGAPAVAHAGLDFSQDRRDWHERFDAEERFARMYGLSSFFIGEQRVAAELGPMMRAAPTEEMRIFLCTQIADEARHVAFFDRFYREVGVLESDNLEDRLAETSKHLNEKFGVLFDELLKQPRRPPGAGARGPRDARRGGDDLPHGHRGHARPHRPALHHRLQRARGHAAGLRRGLHERRARRAPSRRVRRALPARDVAGATRATRPRSSARSPRSLPRPRACCARRGSTRPTATWSSSARA